MPRKKKDRREAIQNVIRIYNLNDIAENNLSILPSGFNPTKTQRKYFAFIQAYYLANDEWPSYEDVAQGMGKSRSTIYEVLNTRGIHYNPQDSKPLYLLEEHVVQFERTDPSEFTNQLMNIGFNFNGIDAIPEYEGTYAEYTDYYNDADNDTRITVFISQQTNDIHVKFVSRVQPEGLFIPRTIKNMAFALYDLFYDEGGPGDDYDDRGFVSFDPKNGDRIVDIINVNEDFLFTIKHNDGDGRSDYQECDNCRDINRFCVIKITKEN